MPPFMNFGVASRGLFSPTAPGLTGIQGQSLTATGNPPTPAPGVDAGTQGAMKGGTAGISPGTVGTLKKSLGRGRRGVPGRQAQDQAQGRFDQRPIPRPPMPVQPPEGQKPIPRPPMPIQPPNISPTLAPGAGPVPPGAVNQPLPPFQPQPTISPKLAPGAGSPGTGNLGYLLNNLSPNARDIGMGGYGNWGG